MRVSIVLPCLDEAESVGLCVREALDAAPRANLRAEVVVVDNGSTDGSAEVATAAGARVVDGPVRGYGAALLTGFHAAVGDVLVMADADYTYDLSRIPDLVAPVFDDRRRPRARLPARCRNPQTMPWLHRHVGTPALTFLTARACGRRVVGDSQSGFRAFRRDKITELGLHSTGMELASEMLIRSARSGWRVSEIDTGYRPRIGESKLATFTTACAISSSSCYSLRSFCSSVPGATMFVVGLVMQIVVLLQPSGVEVGSLRWQPIFFAGILIVVGVQALLAEPCSRTARPSRRRASNGVTDSSAGPSSRTVVCGRRRADRAGLVINLVLFFVWLGNDDLSPTRNLGSASLAQSLIIVGGTPRASASSDASNEHVCSVSSSVPGRAGR